MTATHGSRVSGTHVVTTRLILFGSMRILIGTDALSPILQTGISMTRCSARNHTPEEKFINDRASFELFFNNYSLGELVAELLYVPVKSLSKVLM